MEYKYTYGYTDGSGTHHDKGNGGIGFVLLQPESKKVLGMQGMYIPDHRIGRLELLAAINAVHYYVKHINHFSVRKRKAKLLIHTDSQYVANTYNEYLLTWMQNRAVLESKAHWQLWEQVNYYRSVLEIKWIKGHNKDPWNEMADYLAGKSRKFKENFLI